MRDWRKLFVQIRTSKLEAVFASLILAFSSFGQLARAQPSCFATPTRQDDAFYQNWYAVNKCGGQMTVRYTETYSDGRVEAGPVFVAACKKARIIQTFLNSKITFDRYELEPGAASKTCVGMSQEESSPSK
jgi:hypothetical protein